MVVNMTIATLLEEAKVFFNKATDFVDGQLTTFKPWEIVVLTIITLVLMYLIYNFVFDDEKSVSQRLKVGFFYYVKRFPIIRSIVEDRMKPVLHEMSAGKLFPLKAGMSYKNVLPYEGKSRTSILKEVDEYLALDTVDWSKGNVSGTVYGGDPDLTLVASTMYHKFAWSNPLHPDVFPSLRKMEAEVVRMTCSLFHGDRDKSCGFVTTGGTESILLACKTYRDWAYSKGIKKPEMVIPISAHAAFEKGAAYFKIKLKHVPVDPITRKVDLHAMKRAINKNTCMLVGSTPQFPHGVLDPIEGIAALGRRYGVPVHVDACLGGFLLPFMGEAGFPIPPCDFTVPGVTSISADTHKYGCAPKGSSVIMYNSNEFAHHQYFVSPDWQGGIYATPMFAGSRSGAIVAACWGTMVHIGREGYISNTRKIISTARTIENGLAQMKSIFVFGKPEMSVIAFGSMDFDIFRLSGELTSKGWNLNTLQFPPSIHLCCTMPHTKPGVADRFLSDVNDAVNSIMQSPKTKPTGAGAIYGMAQSIPDRSIVSTIACGFLDALYDTSQFARVENGKA